MLGPCSPRLLAKTWRCALHKVPRVPHPYYAVHAGAGSERAPAPRDRWPPLKPLPERPALKPLPLRPTSLGSPPLLARLGGPSPWGPPLDERLALRLPPEPAPGGMAGPPYPATPPGRNPGAPGGAPGTQLCG